MEFIKEAKPQVIAIIICLFFLFVTLFIYFTPTNIDNKTNYNVPISELI